MTDQDLLRAYADSRDVDSLGTFVGRHEASLIRFVSGVVQDERAAQAIVQRIFLRIARQPRRLARAGNPHNGLFRVAHDLTADHLRRTNGRPPHRPDAAHGAGQKAAPETAGSSVRKRAVKKVAGSKAAAKAKRKGARKADERRQVHAALHALSPALRELMLLKMQLGKTYRDIAEITGMSTTDVGHRMHQAMQLLARKLRGGQEAGR